MESLISTILQAQQGDRGAFGMLVRRFQDMAVRYAYTILHDFHLAEDAAQEAFIEAHRALPQLREPEAFAAWLRRIIFKQCDRLTRGKQLWVVDLDAAVEIAATERLPEMMEAKEMRDQVLQAMAALPTEERTVIILFYVSEYSHKEIAAFLELPLATVNNRLRRGRKQLQERIMEMVQENLHEQRPSRNDDFAEQVLNFINAADAGHADEVQAILNANPSLVDAKGQAPYSTRSVRALHYALNYGHVAVVEHLLAAGADINAKADESWAPLHYALRGAHPALAQLLIARGATVDVYSAAALGDLAQVQVLIEQDPDLLKRAGPGGATPLHFATTAPVAAFLLARGADVNARDARGRTPLLWNADKPELTALLLAHGATIEDIFLACALGDYERVRAFLDADPTLVHAHKDPRTGTPLHIAADKGQIAVAQLLLTRGAKINAESDSGNVTPMHEAAFSGQAEMVKFLLAQGADPNMRDTEFQATPLAWAQFNRQDEVMALLKV